MEFPCSKCEIVAKNPYAHYCGTCENCKLIEEYELWLERQEVKRQLDISMQKAKRRKVNKDQGQ